MKISRRTLLGGAASTLACEEGDSGMGGHGMKFNTKRMWGSTEALDVVSSPLSAAPSFRSVQAQQLARVENDAPMNWSFFFGAKLISGPPVPAATLNVSVAFNVYFGVGRGKFSTAQGARIPASQQFLNGFAVLNFSLAAGEVPSEQPAKWTNTGRVVVDDVAGTVQEVSWFGAENIQCDAQILGTAATSTPCRIQLYSGFTPWMPVEGVNR